MSKKFKITSQASYKQHPLRSLKENLHSSWRFKSKFVRWSDAVPLRASATPTSSGHEVGKQVDYPTAHCALIGPLALALLHR